MSFVCLLFVEAVSVGQQIKFIGSFVSHLLRHCGDSIQKIYYDNNRAANSGVGVAKQLTGI
jgi:ABC-type cobalamin transport system permease subunit